LIVSEGLGAAQAVVMSGDFDRTGATRPLTEEKQSGTAPDPEAIALDTDQAPEQAGTAVAVADEPAVAEPAVAEPTDRIEETPASDTASDSQEAAPAVAEASMVAPTESETTESVAQEPAAPESEAPESVALETAVADGDATTGQVDAPPSASDDAEVSETAARTADALSDDDTADAPSAGEEEEREPAPVRDLGPEPTTMEELLAEQDSDIKSFKHGDVVEGSVVRIDKDEILVDIGAKSEGVVSNRELYGRHAESQPQLAIGDVVLVYVLQPESQEGHAVLSLRRAGLERKWRSMQEQFEAGVIIEAPVIDHNKGGLIVDCGIRGFVPISQIVDFPRRPQNDQPRDAAQEIAEKLMPFVGRKLRLKILEVNRKANRLILSEKVALYEERREKRDELFSSLQVGQKVTGTVRSIAPFGVFIDLGGIDGLVHKSELSWNKVNNPESGYKVGEEVEAEVIDINHERGRISLSIRRLQPDPWHSTVADFNVGDVIDGTVTKLVNFGAFVRVRDGLEGLIHISELSHQRVAHPGDVVHEGQALKLKIISLDSERHRLGLSLKQAEEPPARPAPEPGQALPAGAPGPRAERRPRPERGYSMSDAVQEPEGGIDNTLAAAFAQVRDQLAASEEAQSDTATGDAAEASAPAADAVEAPDEAEAVAEPVAAPEPEAAAETSTAADEAEAGTADDTTADDTTAEDTSSAAVAEPEVPEAEAEAAPVVEAEPEPEAAVEAAEAEPAAEAAPAVEEVEAEEPAVEAAEPVTEAAEPVTEAEPVEEPEPAAEAAPLVDAGTAATEPTEAVADVDAAGDADADAPAGKGKGKGSGS
jgi:small subunit ribosomal protein S1